MLQQMEDDPIQVAIRSIEKQHEEDKQGELLSVSFQGGITTHATRVVLFSALSVVTVSGCLFIGMSGHNNCCRYHEIFGASS